MTIAYNSAQVQTETLNFTFARQAVIVYFEAEQRIQQAVRTFSLSTAVKQHESILCTNQQIHT